MADLGIATRPVVDAEPTRQVTRRRTLPGGRAVVGALLITAAAVGVFAAWLTATAAPTTRYVVAAVDIPPGTRVTADMVDHVAIDLPATQAERAVTNLDRVVDRVALGPVRAGDLVQASTFLAPETPVGTTTFTFAIPSSRALGGAIAAGDRIDVVATFDGSTAFVARNVAVLGSSTSTGASGGTLITVAADDPATVLAIANALDTAQVHVARTDPDVTGSGPAPVTAGRG